MITNRIYQHNSYTRNNKTKVIDLTSKNGFDVLVFEETIFFPEGGGQPSDMGVVHSVHGDHNITYVYDHSLETEVYHVTDAPCGTFAIGDEVETTLDWDRRFSNMQRHTGEHMLSGVIHSMYNGTNKGFHMGADYIAIDIEADGRILTAVEVAAAELEVNKLIWENHPVKTTWFGSYDESLILPVRKQVPHEGRVSVVTIGTNDDIKDCIACCGTHLSSTGQVGIIKVTKSEPSRGMTRIYFDCGMNALNNIIKDHDVLYRVTSSLSCGRDDLEKNLATSKEKTEEYKQRISKLNEYVSDKEYERIVASIKACNGSSGLYKAYSNLLDVNSLLKLGFRLSEELIDGQLLALIDENSNTVLLFSEDVNLSCGKIVKENVSAFNGRGGGRPDNARASFSTMSDALSFVNHLNEIVV